jgi:hypothetical protein
LVPLDGGQIPVRPEIVFNSRGFTGKTDDYCELYFDEYADGWELMWVIPKEQEVLTAFRVDEDTMKLQYKSRQAIAWWAEDETDWIDAHQGTDVCPEDAGTGIGTGTV